MKTLILLTIALILSISALPQKNTLNYQCIVRNDAGLVIPDKDITITISIVDENRNILYDELIYTKTNNYGLIDLQFGYDTEKVKDLFSEYEYLEYHTIIQYDNQYIDMGYKKLPYTPRSYHANNANHAHHSRYADTAYFAYISDTANVSYYSINDKVNDLDSLPDNEIQELSINRDTLTISKGNSVLLPKQPEKMGISDLYFPDGMTTDFIFFSSGDTYTVPEGKTLYFYSVCGILLNDNFVFGMNVIKSQNTFTVLYDEILNEENGENNDLSLILACFLVDENHEIINITTDQFICEKDFVMLTKYSPSFNFRFNGMSYWVAASFPTILKQGTIITSGEQMTITGYYLK